MWKIRHACNFQRHAPSQRDRRNQVCCSFRLCICCQHCSFPTEFFVEKKAGLLVAWPGREGAIHDINWFLLREQHSKYVSNQNSRCAPTGPTSPVCTILFEATDVADHK